MKCFYIFTTVNLRAISKNHSIARVFIFKERIKTYSLTKNTFYFRYALRERGAKNRHPNIFMKSRFVSGMYFHMSLPLQELHSHIAAPAWNGNIRPYVDTRSQTVVPAHVYICMALSKEYTFPFCRKFFPTVWGGKEREKRESENMRMYVWERRHSLSFYLCD